MKALALLCLVVIIEYCYGFGYQQQSTHGNQGYGYQPKTYKKKGKSCYQCAYSPPKTYYGKKVIVESVKYGKDYGTQKNQGYGQQQSGGYGQQQMGYGQQQQKGGYGQQKGGYVKKTYVPVPYTVNGGWDKCMGPFSAQEAEMFGLDVWDCSSNCYVRKDPNGDIFRGCYKGEFGVNPYKAGCHYQGGSIYCFCEGDKCNNGAAPH